MKPAQPLRPLHAPGGEADPGGCEGLSMWTARHAVLPPAGRVELNTFPAESAAIQRDPDRQVIASSEAWPQVPN
jgi:hypothetical protein